MRLIVGLGNPGLAYARTPHNLGFLAVDQLAERSGIRVERPEAKSLVGLGSIAGCEIALAKPQTMMNLSGLAVRDLLQRYECGPADLVVLYDDVALPWGALRIRERGTAGGHNGLKSIIGSAGTLEFLRVRMGVQPDHPVGDLADLRFASDAQGGTGNRGGDGRAGGGCGGRHIDARCGACDEPVQPEGRAARRGKRNLNGKSNVPGGPQRMPAANRGIMEERLYDLIFICMPATPEEEITKLIGVLEQAVNDRGGKLEKTEKWGTRKMAYRVSKQREGYYVYMALRSAQGELIKELERRLRVSDPVIKYMTVRLDEEIKRQQKLVARRDRRAKRRPRKAAAGAPSPMPAPGTAPGAAPSGGSTAGPGSGAPPAAGGASPANPPGAGE